MVSGSFTLVCGTGHTFGETLPPYFEGVEESPSLQLSLVTSATTATGFNCAMVQRKTNQHLVGNELVVTLNKKKMTNRPSKKRRILPKSDESESQTTTTSLYVEVDNVSASTTSKQVESDHLVDEAKRRRKIVSRKAKIASRDERQTALIQDAHNAKIVVGIDSSYTSPAACVVDRRKSREKVHYTIICFAQTKTQLRAATLDRHTISTDSGSTVDVRVLRYPAFTTSTERYSRVVGALLETLAKCAPSGKDTFVAIEDYAYSKMRDDQASHFIQLAEIGGVLRHELSRAGYKHANLSISAWRSHFSPGRSDHPKRLAWQAFERATPGIDWRSLIPTPTKWANHDAEGSTEDPPKPADDVCEAWGIADYLHAC